MTSHSLSHKNLLAFLGSIAESNKRLYAPQQKGEKIFFAPVKDVHTVAFDYLQTTESPKELLFPKYQKLISFDMGGGDVQVTDHAKTPAPECVLFGSRPCDAAALHRLAEFFARDISDTFVAQRQNALTVVSVSCMKTDATVSAHRPALQSRRHQRQRYSFTPVEDGCYYRRILRKKANIGDAYHRIVWAESACRQGNIPITSKRTFRMKKSQKNFQRAFGMNLGRNLVRCVDAARALLYVRSVHVSISRMKERLKKGDRIRSWDSCGFSLFTLHTSGHNPRPVQRDRWRQRVMHKFSYQPEQYALPGCVGCGRCSRACPADVNLKEELIDIATKVEAA